MKAKRQKATNPVCRYGLFFVLAATILLLSVKGAIADFNFNYPKIDAILCVPGWNTASPGRTLFLLGKRFNSPPLDILLHGTFKNGKTTYKLTDVTRETDGKIHGLIPVSLSGLGSDQTVTIQVKTSDGLLSNKFPLQYEGVANLQVVEQDQVADLVEEEQVADVAEPEPVTAVVVDPDNKDNLSDWDPMPQPGGPPAVTIKTPHELQIFNFSYEYFDLLVETNPGVDQPYWIMFQFERLEEVPDVVGDLKMPESITHWWHVTVDSKFLWYMPLPIPLKSGKFINGKSGVYRVRVRAANAKPNTNSLVYIGGWSPWRHFSVSPSKASQATTDLIKIADKASMFMGAKVAKAPSFQMEGTQTGDEGSFPADSFFNVFTELTPDPPETELKSTKETESMKVKKIASTKEDAEMAKSGDQQAFPAKAPLFGKPPELEIKTITGLPSLVCADKTFQVGVTIINHGDHKASFILCSTGSSLSDCKKGTVQLHEIGKNATRTLPMAIKPKQSSIKIGKWHGKVFLGKGKTAPDDTADRRDKPAPAGDISVNGTELFWDENPGNHQVELNIDSQPSLCKPQNTRKKTPANAEKTTRTSGNPSRNQQ